MSKLRDITGQRFGKLVAVEYTGEIKYHKAVWKFKCDCGNEKNIVSSNVVYSGTISCGCIASDKQRKWHGKKRERSAAHLQGVKARQRRHRESFLEMYGKSCRCCGEGKKEFLTIEHIRGQAGGKESSTTAYRKAALEYRPDLYEVLCMNCNHSKGRYGYCPHENHF